MAEKYSLVEVIGSGSFGRAWLAEQNANGKPCVVKEVQVVGLSKKARDQALTEVSALAKCKHINVIRYKDAFIDKMSLNIVMEYADGGILYTTTPLV